MQPDPEILNVVEKVEGGNLGEEAVVRRYDHRIVLFRDVEEVLGEPFKEERFSG